MRAGHRPTMKQHLSTIFIVSALGIVLGVIAVTPIIAQETNVTVWGGQHVRITMNATGAEIEFDCASGTIAAPLKVDAQGKFQADGTYTREHPGPVMKMATQPFQPSTPASSRAIPCTWRSCCRRARKVWALMSSRGVSPAASSSADDLHQIPPIVHQARSFDTVEAPYVILGRLCL